MTTRIRLARGGSKKRPYYRIVVANSRAPRDGDFIEKIGTYNPLLNKDDENRVVIKSDRVKYWLAQGAQPSDKVITFIEKANIELPDKIKKSVEKARKLRKPKAPKKEPEATDEAPAPAESA